MSRIYLKENFRVCYAWRVITEHSVDYFALKENYLKYIEKLAQLTHTKISTDSGYIITYNSYGYIRPQLTEELFASSEDAEKWLNSYFSLETKPAVHISVSSGDMCPNTVSVSVHGNGVIKCSSDNLDNQIIKLLDALNVDYSLTRWD